MSFLMSFSFVNLITKFLLVSTKLSGLLPSQREPFSSFDFVPDDSGNGIHTYPYHISDFWSDETKLLIGFISFYRQGTCASVGFDA